MLDWCLWPIIFSLNLGAIETAAPACLLFIRDEPANSILVVMNFVIVPGIGLWMVILAVVNRHSVARTDQLLQGNSE